MVFSNCIIRKAVSVELLKLGFNGINILLKKVSNCAILGWS